MAGFLRAPSLLTTVHRGESHGPSFRGCPTWTIASPFPIQHSHGLTAFHSLMTGRAPQDRDLSRCESYSHKAQACSCLLCEHSQVTPLLSCPCRGERKRNEPLLTKSGGLMTVLRSFLCYNISICKLNQDPYVKLGLLGKRGEASD